MKKALTIVPALLCAAALSAAAQTVQSYRFQQSLFPTGSGQSLTEVFACGATAGTYQSQTVATSEGQCGAGQQIVRSFNAGGGFSHANGFITGTYTIDLFFKFNTLGNYRRIIDFQNGVEDDGLYINGNCLRFYPSGNSGNCLFQSNVYYLITLVRDAATNKVDVYVNGNLFVSGYNDVNGLYAPATASTPIIIFRDNIADLYPCEVSSGAVRYFSLRNATATAAEVAATYTNICAIALSQDGVDFNGRVQDENGILQWRASGKADDVTRYEVQRSTDGEAWTVIGAVRAAVADATHSYTDARMAPGANYYRLRLVKHDGSVDFSNTVTLSSTARDSKAWTVASSPLSSSIEFVQSGAVREYEVSLHATDGRRMWHGRSNNGRVSISSTALPAGMYVAVFLNAYKQATLRVVVQH